VEKTLDERILEAQDEIADLRAHMPAWPTQRRLLARAEKRFADLIAVREGRAVEVYATVSASGVGAWRGFGMGGVNPSCNFVLGNAVHEPGDRLTILRGVAYLPVRDTIETEAESEEP
jgi:hypothetical protein